MEVQILQPFKYTSAGSAPVHALPASVAYGLWSSGLVLAGCLSCKAVSTARRVHLSALKAGYHLLQHMLGPGLAGRRLGDSGSLLPPHVKDCSALFVQWCRAKICLEL